MIKLSPRYKRFCDAYIVSLNGQNSAIQAGICKTNARAWASHALKREDVKAYLAESVVAVKDDLKVTAERVLGELARLAFHDVGSYYKVVNGKEVLKSLDELTPDQRAAISEYCPKEKKIKLYSKDPSLDKLGKHLKLFTELHEQQHTFTVMESVTKDGVKLEFNVGLPKK